MLIGLGVVGVTPLAGQHESDLTVPIEIGIEEQLGEFVPMGLRFLDATGDSVFLRDLIDKPTILTLVYYHCPTICKPLLGAVVEVVDKTELTPGEDYDLVTISFDETDTPESAATIKTNFTNSLGVDFAPEAWKFLTADSVTIAQLTQAVGFGFQRREKDFAHGTCLIALSPDGKIVRYLYGLRYLPFDLKMAVAEATKGTAVPSIAKVMQYCFSYDPKGRKYALNLNRVAGTGILLFAVGWVLYITSAGRRKGRTKA
jgi:protein SCO1/2